MLSLSRIETRSFAVRSGLLLLVIATAAMVGYAVAHQIWMFVGALFFVPFFLLWPVEVCLGLFAFFVPFEEVATIAPGTSISFLAGAVAGGGLIAVGVIDGRLEKPPRAALWWSLFMILGAATALWAYNPDKVLDRIPTAFALLLLYLAAVSLKVSKRELYWVTMLAIAGGVLASLLSARGYSQGVGFQGTGRSTLATDELAGDPNMYAAALLLPISLSVGHFLSSKKNYFRVAMAGCAGIVGFAVLLTMSRGALVSIMVMIAVYALRYRLKWKLLVPIAVMSIGLAFMPEKFFTRLALAADTGGAGRVPIWIAGLHAAWSYGLFGAGMDCFPNVYERFAGFAPEFHGMHADSHNIYLATLVEFGIGGLMIKFTALWSQLRAAWPSPGRKASEAPMVVAAEAACWAILAAGMFLNVFWRKSFWLVLIMLVLSVKARKRDEEAELEQPSEPLDVGKRPYLRWYHEPVAAAPAATIRRPASHRFRV